MPANHLLKTKKEFKISKKQGDTNYVYKNELDKACFQHDMAYGGVKNLAKRTASDKVLRDKAFNIAKNPTYDGYQRELASMVYKFLDKKSTGSGANTQPDPIQKKNENDERLAEELHELIIRKF